MRPAQEINESGDASRSIPLGRDGLTPGDEASEGRFPVMAQETLYKRIANHVRDLIETRQLLPGERLPAERELAQMLGVSRLPIREAMRTLAAQGLIEIRRGRGTFVVPQSIEATIDQFTVVLLSQRYIFEEFFAVRRLLEPAAASWAAVKADREDVGRLEQVISTIERAARCGTPDFDALADGDAQLHIEIATCSRNRVLVRIMQAMQHTHREQLETSLRYEGRVPQTIKDHRRIVSAIANGDPVEAGNAMTDHLANGEMATLARIEGRTPASRLVEMPRADGPTGGTDEPPSIAAVRDPSRQPDSKPLS